MTTKAQTQETPKTQSDVNALTNPEFSQIDESVVERQQADRAQKMKAIRFLTMPTKTSTDLVGQPFDIVDAVKTRINGEDSIAFLIRLHNERNKIYKVNKAKNIFTEAYLDYFETFREGEIVVPMLNFTFAKIEGGKAGNQPVVFQSLD